MFHVKHCFVSSYYNKEERGHRKMVYIVTALFIALDMLTGLVKAFKEKKYTSTVMREGLFHKCGSILLVVFGVLVDYAQSFVDIGVTIPVAVAICSYIILMEIGSIIENLGKINPDIVPSKIKPFFSKLKEGE
jgi:toxin secretion/phage lysis holin